MIRSYKPTDYENICSWVGTRIPEGMLVENGTFVLEIENVAALTLSVFLTQSKQVAYLMGFYKNPIFKSISLEPFGQQLWNHCFEHAQSKGYKRILCFAETNVPKLQEKYMRFGMTKTIDLVGFVKEI